MTARQDSTLANGVAVPEPGFGTVLAPGGSPPFELIDSRRADDALVEARSTVAHGAVLDHPELDGLAAQYGVSVPQLCIRYGLELGLLPLPKTANPDHPRGNLAVDFAITADDMARLQAADHGGYGEAARFPVFAKSRRASAASDTPQ